MFKNTVYMGDKFFITEYFLKNKFKLINVISIFYSNYKHNYLKKLNIFFLKTWSMNWVRVSFKGKGFRLRKFKLTNKLTFNFGHSHWSKALLDNNYFFKKIKRQNYICLIRYYHLTKYFKKKIKFIKLLNVYTKRGLRLRKQFIKRRFGKISQVVSSLH